jgi:hypothetical protein
LDCLLTATVRKDKDGSTLGYQGIARDVTERKRNENKLKQTPETLRKAMGGTIQAMSLAVADAVEAIASHRPYRPSLGLEPALEEISRLRGTAYDPAVVDACLRIFREKGYQIK